MYAVQAKGISSDVWLPMDLAHDLATVGFSNTKIIAKTDTEPLIIYLRNELASARVGTPTALDD